MAVSEPAYALKGGCQCGQVRYELARPPHEIYVCHCRECRKQSASAFGISAMARSADIRLVAGRLQHWTRIQTRPSSVSRCSLKPSSVINPSSG